MLDFLKANMHPAQIAGVLALVTPGVAMLFLTPLARWGRRWLLLVVAFYLVLSTPAGAGLLARTLSGGYQPLRSAAEAKGAQAIVLLGSGSVNVRASGKQLSIVNAEAGLRALEVARLFELLNGPLVIASGGVTERDRAAAPESVALQHALLELGVPSQRIVLESTSKNTRDEVLIVKQMLADRGIGAFVLVTSPLHMRRSMLAFEAQGMHPVPSPSQLMSDRSAGRSPFFPNDAWLLVGDSALYEWMARVYYWYQGWLR